MKIDLHTHTNASDGELSPTALLAHALERKLDALAITDHDTTAGIERLVGQVPGSLQLIPGIELSTAWHKTGVHIIGLSVDPGAAVLRAGIARQQTARLARAEQIAARLTRKGFSNALGGAMEVADGATLGRPHFARYLAASGQLRSEQEAFNRYLGRGKIGDIQHDWASMDEVVAWIRSAGGIAILAHPGRYGLSNLKLEELVRTFRAAGGQALEVVSGAQDSSLTRRLAAMATRHGLAASCGSDFHRPGQGWAALGSVAALPAGCSPVWELPLWPGAAYDI